MFVEKILRKRPQNLMSNKTFVMGLIWTILWTNVVRILSNNNCVYNVYAILAILWNYNLNQNRWRATISCFTTPCWWLQLIFFKLKFPKQFELISYLELVPYPTSSFNLKSGWYCFMFWFQASAKIKSGS